MIRFIVTLSRSFDEDMKTSIPYIFGAGDVTNTHLRQIITACGDGARAATSVIKYLNK